MIHFSTSHSGGAAIAAKSLNKVLKSSGVNSQIFFLGSQGLTPQEFLTVNRSIWEKVSSKTYTFLSSIVSRKVLFTIFSSKVSALNTLIGDFNPNSTVLHFHNWFNMGNFDQFKEIANHGYKIVFTLHDERIYTGGCHYALNCERFTSNCKNCPNIVRTLSFAPSYHLKSTERNVSESQFTFIAPSKWIQARALSSTILGNSNVVHIPNYITADDRSLRNESSNFNLISNQKLSLGIGSMNPLDSIKGGELVKEIIRKGSHQRFELIFLKDFSDIESFWVKVDFLLVPSKIDNSPNVIHEAKMRGIPVIATDVGGVSELLGENDILLNDDSYESLINTIENLQTVESEKVRWRIRKELETYRRDAIKLHVKLYKEITVP